MCPAKLRAERARYFCQLAYPVMRSGQACPRHATRPACHRHQGYPLNMA